MAPRRKKPPYRIPLLAETMAEPRNGLTVVSTFAGGGGSSYGYWMAGYTVRAALEFDEPAIQTYHANFPDTPVVGRDIRKVSGEQLLEVAGLEVGELDVLDGSPPCTCFSMAGKREKGWGKKKQYTATSKKQIVDDLFFEYARLVGEMRPRAFVAENVRGMVIGKAKGYFKLVLRRLRAKGYRVKVKVLDAQWLGVPQRRQRVIFVGIREDLGIEPSHPAPLSYNYSIADACPWISRVYIGRDAKQKAGIQHRADLSANPREKGSGYQDVDSPSPSITGAGISAFWIAQHFVEVLGEASIEGTAVGREWDKLSPGGQSKKYFNLLKARLDRPSPTITGLGGSNRGIATVTLPHEKRKFTIPELRRICGFPDDYVLTGKYGEQWARLGRSVPPPMTRAVGEALRDALLGLA